MSRTLGEMRKDLTLDTASDIHKIAALFVKVAQKHPDAVKDILPTMMHRDGRADQMVEFYADMAEYLMRTFNTR